MFKKLLTLLSVCVLFSPALLAEMQMGNGIGGGMSGGMGGGMGGGFNSGSGQHRKNSNQESKRPAPEPAITDNVSDILAFQDKLGLTSQQIISIRMIQADAREEELKRSAAVKECRQELDLSMSRIKPDFTNIRAMLKDLNGASAYEAEVQVDAYEKAYSLLTDQQKDNLAFFRSVRHEQTERSAAEAAAAAQAGSSPAQTTGTPGPQPGGAR